MIILALDLSTKSTGAALFDNQELKKYKCITATSSNLFMRIHKITNELEHILKTQTIDKVVIEEVLMDDVHNNSTFKALMYLQAFVVDKLNEYNLTPIFLVSSEWRKKCGIKTGAGVRREILKSRDVKFVKSQFGIDVNDDIADAIGIGFAVVGGVIKESQVETSNDGFEFA